MIIIPPHASARLANRSSVVISIRARACDDFVERDLRIILVDFYLVTSQKSVVCPPYLLVPEIQYYPRFTGSECGCPGNDFAVEVCNLRRFRGTSAESLCKHQRRFFDRCTLLLA